MEKLKAADPAQIAGLLGPRIAEKIFSQLKKMAQFEQVEQLEQMEQMKQMEGRSP